MTCHDSLGRRVISRAFRAGSVLLLVVLASCDTPLDPRLDIMPSEALVEFRAVRGSAAPVTQTITVTNSGGGRLGPVSCPAAPAEWLACSVSAGNVVTLTANPAGLTTDPARATVILTAPGGSASVEVALVLEQPVLTVSPATLAFTATELSGGTTPTSATVTVTNTGAGGLAALGAITCAPSPSAANVTCAVSQGTGALTVSVDPTGVAPGTYVYSLVVDAEHNSVAQTVSVSLAVSMLPRIGLSRQTLHFEAIRGTVGTLQQTVSVSNLGGGQLGPVTCPENPATWLTCAVSGTTLTFTANPSGLTASPAPVSVSISAGNAVNSPQAVSVSFAIAQPLLGLSRGALTLTATEADTLTTPAQNTVTVINTGAGTLASLGAITCVPPTGSPVACIPDAATGVLTVSVDPTDLSRGVHVFPLAVSALHSGVSQVLTVTVSVTAPPTLVLAPAILHFQAIRGTTAPIVQIVDITNGGGGSLGVITCPLNPAVWLTCTVTDSTRITIAAYPAGLLSSPYSVGIPVTATGAANSPVTLPVTFTIQQPVLAVSAAEVSFQGDAGTGATTPAFHVVLVTNANQDAGTLGNLGTITCTVSSPASCVVNQATGELTLTIDPTGLSAGRHARVVTVSAPHASNGSVTVTIFLDVT